MAMNGRPDDDNLLRPADAVEAPVDEIAPHGLLQPLLDAVAILALPESAGLRVA